MPRKPRRPFKPNNPKARHMNILQIMSHGLLAEPTAQEIIDQVREQTGILDPLDESTGSAQPACDRSEVRACVTELLQTAVWPEEEFLTSMLNYVFRPEKLLQGPIPELEGEPATPQEAEALMTLQRLFFIGLTKTDFQKLFAEMITDLLTDYAIYGNAKPPREMPSWLTGNSFEFPFLFGDKIIVAVATRFSDIDELAALQLVKTK